jgi:hypothetical protein
MTAVVAAIVGLILAAGGATAASQYVISSIKQIKPSVLKKFQPALAYVDRLGTAATMCAAGTDTTGQCEVGSSDARCPGGAIATGGGLDGGTAPPVLGTIGYSEPDNDGRGWHVVMVNDNSASTATVTATAVCLGTSRQGFTAGGAVPRSVRSQIRTEVGAMRARR